jgi:hypothetical protein
MIDSEALNYWKFLLKLTIPIILLSCKAKIINEQKCIDSVVFNFAKDTTSYHWSDNFTDNQLRELVRTNKLIIK